MRKWISDLIVQGGLPLPTPTMLRAFPPNLPLPGRMFGGFEIGFAIYAAGSGMVPWKQGSSVFTR